MTPESQPYMGTAEVAEYLGQSKQTICNWRKRRADFPRPVKELRAGPVWQTSIIVNYKQRMSERHLDSNPAVELMPWEANDEDCVLCDEPHSALGGVDSTKGWICYPCVAWIKRLAKELPDLQECSNWRAELDSVP